MTKFLHNLFYLLWMVCLIGTATFVTVTVIPITPIDAKTIYYDFFCVYGLVYWLIDIAVNWKNL